MLALGGYKEYEEDGVRDDVDEQFELKNGELDAFDIVAAYYEADGYEVSHYLLLRHRDDGALYENEASHCSCMGFEDSFSPTRIGKQYLLNRLATPRSGYTMPFSGYSESNKGEAARFRELVEALP